MGKKSLRKDYLTIMDDNFPEDMTVTFGDQKLIYKKRTWKIEDEQGQVVEKGLRYGENPGQQAALYELVNGNLALGDCRFIEPNNGLVGALAEEQLLQFGKHPGKINLTDLDNGLNIIKYIMDKPCAVVLKHNNPSGAAIGSTIAEACYKAYMADSIAAFGGCVVLNRELDKECAEMLSKVYIEVVAAPSYAPGAVDILKARKNLRIVEIKKIEELAKYCDFRFVDFKSLIDGGIIVQQSPLNKIMKIEDFQPAITTYKGQEYKIDRKPTQKEYDDMLFGWFVEQGVTSNSVLYIKNGVTVGIGTGEQDRVGVARIAAYKARICYANALSIEKFNIPYFLLELEINDGKRSGSDKDDIDVEVDIKHGNLLGSVMISDAFFPARDGIDIGINHGISAIVQPGGSIRDYEVIEVCNSVDPKVAMVFTGQRTFKH